MDGRDAERGGCPGQVPPIGGRAVTDSAACAPYRVLAIREVFQ